MPQKPIRVLLVDDSPLALVVLQRMLAASPEIEVVGTATNGREALELIPAPAAGADLHRLPHAGNERAGIYPAGDGPLPAPDSGGQFRRGSEADTDRVFALLEAGAVDVFPKPRGGPDADALAAEQFIKKVKIVAGVWVRGRPPKEATVPPAPSLARPTRSSPMHRSARRLRAPQIVAIGASTGGPPALQTILSQLPGHFPLPILCVQHISAGFLPGLVSWLAAHCQVKIQIARPGEIPQPGMRLLSLGKHASGYRPQRPAAGLERAAARRASPFRHRHLPLGQPRYYGDAAIGVLLTGMGRDGGEGMQALAQAGALTIAQDEASCVVFGMPRDAVERGAARAVLPLGDIARALIEAANPRAAYAFGRKELTWKTATPARPF